MEASIEVVREAPVIPPVRHIELTLTLTPNEAKAIRAVLQNTSHAALEEGFKSAIFNLPANTTPSEARRLVREIGEALSTVISKESL